MLEPYPNNSARFASPITSPERLFLLVLRGDQSSTYHTVLIKWYFATGKPIFSVDVHPDGNKFATGGQGNESGRVVIWNMKPVLVLEAELDKNCPKILCQLDNHLQCVNSVRWSLSGDMLASGGDDKLIMIWKKGKGPSAVFGNSGITKTSESWRCVSTLRGHAGTFKPLFRICLYQ